MTAFVFEATHQLYFSTREPVPVSDVIESLQGLEKLIRMSPRALQGLTGVEIDHVDVFVDHLESGSLLERVLIRFYFRDEEGLNRFIDKVRANVGDGVARGMLIGIVLATLLYMGAQLLAESKGGPTTHITANNNVIITAGAGELNITPEMFQAIVRNAITDQKELAKSTVQVLKPNRGDSESSITFDDDSSLSMPAAAIREVPTVVEFEPDTRVEDVPAVELNIRASNRDSLKTGWTARLPLRFDQKLKLKLADGIDPEALASQPVVRGDIQIHYRRDTANNRYVPDHVVLLRTLTP